MGDAGPRSTPTCSRSRPTRTTGGRQRPPRAAHRGASLRGGGAALSRRHRGRGARSRWLSRSHRAPGADADRLLPRESRTSRSRRRWLPSRRAEEDDARRDLVLAAAGMKADPAVLKARVADADRGAARQPRARGASSSRRRSRRWGGRAASLYDEVLTEGARSRARARGLSQHHAASETRSRRSR